AEVGIRNGIITYSDLYSAQGKDWEECFEQRKREQEKIKDLGLEINQKADSGDGKSADANSADAVRGSEE
ncbi:MAG TPA: hypothetical protein PKL77_10740, partial [Candidatus Omnitrophota bacterium]|nr:hypothetical protein [Candidatus Omnitrophota bacterium]